MSLDALLTWVSFALAVASVALAVYFFVLQKRDGRIASAKTLEMGGEITRLRQTNERSERRRAPVHVLLDQPSRPESVNRPEFLSEVLGELFVNQRNMVVVYGDFGSGKTWLAQEIGRIAQHGAGHIAPFQHGLLSATLGRSPAILNELKRWHDAVTATYVAPAEDEPDQHQGPAAAAAEQETEFGREDKRIARVIESQLTDRYPLVIIDDAWHYADLEALLAAVPERPVLVTTRELEVSNRLHHHAAKVINLHGLTPVQVVDLLGKFIEPALEGGPTPKTAAFIGHLSQQIGRDPYTVTQTGAEVRRRLQQTHGVSWTTISQQRLDELAGEAASWSDDHGKKNKDGGRIFRIRLGMLQDPLQLAVLRTLSLLRPRPEQFSAVEIAALCMPRAGDGPGTAAIQGPAIGATEEALDSLFKAAYLGCSQTEFRYSLHNLSRRTLSEDIGARDRQDFHRAAVAYWRSWVDPRDPDTHIEATTSYQIAITRESPAWMRAARNLIYHLSRLEDRAQARLTFTAFYFELFFWWGFYLRYPVLEEFVLDWQTMRQLHGDPLDADDQEWFAAIRAFHQSFTPGHRSAFLDSDPDWRPGEPDYRGEHHDWLAVTRALTAILRLTGLDGPTEALREHDQWHTRALIDTFLADSYRYQRGAGKLVPKIDDCYAEARSLIKRCDQYDLVHGRKPACDWLASWVDRVTADEALRRALEAPDGATRAKQLRLAQAGAATAMRGVLGGADGGTLTADRAELDYETVALAALTYGDACRERADPRAAAQWYAAAVVMAATWNYRPVTDDYTCMFSGHVSEHIRSALAELLEPDSAGVRQADAIAALRTVLRYGHGCEWGRARLSTAATDPAVLRDPRGFMQLVLGPFPAMGRHDLADPIPAVLDQAAERTLAWIWDTARGHTAAQQEAGRDVTGRPAEPAAAGA